MRNRDMAADYLQEAEVSLRQAELALELRRYNTAVRRAQDCLEFSIKAALRLVGIEYPKEHEVSDVLRSASERFPKWFRAEIDRIARASATLIPKRGLATYGDERRFTPAGELFDRDDALEAMDDARESFEKVKLLLRSFEKASKKQR